MDEKFLLNRIEELEHVNHLQRHKLDKYKALFGDPDCGHYSHTDWDCNTNHATCLECGKRFNCTTKELVR